jgi:type I restriction enzyme R subunit
MIGVSGARAKKRLRYAISRLAVRDEVGAVLEKYLPQEESYGRELFIEKRDKVFELTLDLAINHQRWAA